MKNSIGLFYDGLEFLVESLRKEAELCADHRLRWLKDLYLNLYYDNANKKFKPPTPMQALLAFGGRQFNFNTLENNFHAGFSSLITACSNQLISNGLMKPNTTTITSTTPELQLQTNENDSSLMNPLIRIQESNNLEKLNDDEPHSNSSSTKSRTQDRKSNASISSFRMRNNIIQSGHGVKSDLLSKVNFYYINKL